MANEASEKTFFFKYDPSVAGVAIGVIVFGVIGAMHIFRFVKTYRTFRLKMLVVLSMASFSRRCSQMTFLGTTTDPELQQTRS